MGFFDEITFWHWLIAGVIFIILEMLLPGVLFLWLSIAALITGFLAYLSPDLSLQWLTIIFSGLSLVSVVAGRTILKRSLPATDHPTLNQRGHQYIGRTFTLSEPIVDGFGKITVDDTTWKASGEDMDQGTSVKVVGIEGTVFKVSKKSE
ncbi:MAG: hypothetical protein COB59_07700 [Rhodospirillaceae bacterium]|nr:MAG: hypothetical protein COB59_07700 [Rhodospirillaceae bacterium]